MIDKSRIIRFLSTLEERAASWVEDADKREDYVDVTYYEGQQDIIVDIKKAIEKW